jgi:hypothetical protein
LWPRARSRSRRFGETIGETAEYDHPVRPRYSIGALYNDGSLKVLKPSIEKANDWHEFTSLPEARQYCDALIERGWRWPGVVALVIETVGGADESERLYLRAIPEIRRLRPE